MIYIVNMFYTILTVLCLCGYNKVSAAKVFYDYAMWGDRNTMTLQCPTDGPALRIQIINATAGAFVACGKNVEKWWTCQTQCYSDVGFDFAPYTIGERAHAKELRACQGSGRCQVTILQLVVLCDKTSLASNYEYIYYSCLDPYSRSFSTVLPLTTGITSPGGGSGVTRKTWLKIVSTKAPKKKKKKTKTKPMKKTSSKKSTTKAPNKKVKKKTTEKSKTGGSLKQEQQKTDGNTNQTGKTVGIIIGVLLAVGLVLAGAILAFILWRRRQVQATRPAAKQLNVEDLNPYEEIKEGTTTMGNEGYNNKCFPTAYNGGTKNKDNIESDLASRSDNFFTKSNADLLKNGDQNAKPSTSHHDDDNKVSRSIPALPTEDNDIGPTKSTPHDNSNGIQQNGDKPDGKKSVRRKTTTSSPSHARHKSYAKPYGYDQNTDGETETKKQEEIKYAQLDHSASRNSAATGPPPSRERVTYADIKTC